MKADDDYLRSIYGGEKQYIVPVFQRTYSWEQKHWKELWRDLEYLLDPEAFDEEHFIGTFVFMAKKLSPGKIPNYVLIDGQQRIVTIAIILAMIRNHARTIGKTKKREDLSKFADEIQETYLINKYKKGREVYKVISRGDDRELLIKIINNEEFEKEEENERISKSFEFFNKKIEKFLKESEDDSLENLKKLRNIIMDQLPLVTIILEEKDNPFTIFETLNERGLDLEESDLIRNYVFMQLKIEEQDEFNIKKWIPFENTLRDIGFNARQLTTFYRHYLMRNGSYVKKNGVYIQFKKVEYESLNDLLKDLKKYAEFYKWIHKSNTAPKELAESLLRIKYLNIGTSYPLILHLLNRWKVKEISEREFREVLLNLESFVIRRSICGETTRGYHRTFPSAINALKDTELKQSFIEYFCKKRWPGDEVFETNLYNFELYKRDRDKAFLILKTIEKELSPKETVKFDDLSIEHLMPQTIKDDKNGKVWMKMLGVDWQKIHEKLLHTIGNLTLSGYNIDMSNKPYNVKKKKLEESNLKLNKFFQKIDKWDKDEIEKRSKILIKSILRLWPNPCIKKADPKLEKVKKIDEFVEK